MTETSNILPDWIKRQANIGANIKVDGKQTDENFFWYTLTGCCPLIFESYAIVLHPYWINHKVKRLISSGRIINEDQIEKKDFERVNWSDFYKLYGYEFALNTANQTREKIRQNVLNYGTKKSTWPPFLWFPDEGNCETEELKFILSKLKDLYGDSTVNFYYCLLKTCDWEEERILQANLSEFDELQDDKNLRGNPTAIFPCDKTWCIISDYDLPFTFVGGTEKLIESLTKNNQFDIYKIEPIFKEKLEEDTSH